MMKSAVIFGLAGIAAAIPIAQDTYTTRVPDGEDPVTRTFDNPFPSVEWPTFLPPIPPINQRDAEPQDAVVTRSVILGGPFGKRDDPVETRSFGLGGPFGPLPTGVVVPPFKERDAEPYDPVVTRSFVLPGGPFGKRTDPVTTRKFEFPPGPFGKRTDPVTTRKFEFPPGPFGKRDAEAEAGDPVVTRSFVLPGPFGKRGDYSSSAPAPVTSDYYTTRVVPPSSEAASTRYPVPDTSDYATTRVVPPSSNPAVTRTPTPEYPGITRTFTLPPVPTPTYPPVYPPAINLDPPVKRDAPYPPSLQILGIVYGGTGCPQLNATVGDYGRQLGFASDKFTASIGPKVAVTESRKNCQVNLNLKYTDGWQYGIAAIDYTGYGYLEKGATGVAKATEYFSGQTAQRSFGFTLKGAYDSAFLLSDNAAGTEVLWSPCGNNAMVNVNAEVYLTSTDDNADGYLSINSPIGRTIYLTWRKC